MIPSVRLNKHYCKKTKGLDTSYKQHYIVLSLYVTSNLQKSPQYKKDIISIENVQCRATSLVTTISHLSFPQRLKALQYRGECADIIKVYKILNTTDSIETEQLFTMVSYKSSRGHENWAEVIKHFSCSVLLSMKLQRLTTMKISRNTVFFRLRKV